MYLYFLFYTTMSECMIFYGPTVPEINYSSSSSLPMNVSFSLESRVSKQLI